MKLAQTTLSRRDSLKIARRFNAGNGSPCASSPAGARAAARFNVHLHETQEMPAPFSIRTLKRRERRAPSRSSLRDLNHFATQPGVETPGYCRSSLRDKTAASRSRQRLGLRQPSGAFHATVGKRQRAAAVQNLAEFRMRLSAKRTGN